KALAITPVNPTHPFELPPSGDTVIDFVNELDNPETLEIVLHDKPRHPVLQMLWGIVTQTNVDHAELIWEELVAVLIGGWCPYGTVSKVKSTTWQVITTSIDVLILLFITLEMIIFLGNLKFVPKGESVEVFGMAIPDPLITEAIQQSSYYPKYLKMVVENTKKTPQESASMHPATKQSLERKACFPTLLDEEDEAQQESIPQNLGTEAIKLSLDPALLPQGRAPVGGVTIRDPVSETTSKLHEVVGKGKAVVTEEQVAHSLINLSKKKRTTDQIPSAPPQNNRDRDPASSSTSDSKEHKEKTETASFSKNTYPRFNENLKLITTNVFINDKPERQSGLWSFMKNLDDTFNFGDQFLHDKPTEDDQEKSKVREESDSTIPDSSHQTVTSTPPVIAPFTEVSSSKPSLLVTPPPINTEATTITTSLPEITPFIALQLRVARLEQEMSEVKKTDHSADVLASIRTQVPTAVDNYLGTKLDDALLKVLERHTADLIEKYSVLPGPESVKNQESEKSPKEIIKAKKEQGEEKQDSTYSIRSTDKVDLEEFDLKSALFRHMNKIKSANRNTATTS
ncbi:hypothetical protein Tco_0670730, partial [Tanacetum coccineum]